MAITIPSADVPSSVVVPEVVSTSVSPFLTAASGTLLTRVGSTATVEDSEDDTLSFTFPSGAPAAGVGGLDECEIALAWDIGTAEDIPVSTLLEWVDGTPDNCHVCVAVYKANSAPTSLADVDAATALWLQVRCPTTSRVSTFTKNNDQSLATTNNENKTGSAAVSYVVPQDGEGWGGHIIRHRHTESPLRTIRSSTIFRTGAGSNIYVVLLVGLIGSPGSEQVTKMKFSQFGHTPA